MADAMDLNATLQREIFPSVCALYRLVCVALHQFRCLLWLHDVDRCPDRAWQTNTSDGEDNLYSGKTDRYIECFRL